jgi:hypothetical protein
MLAEVRHALASCNDFEEIRELRDQSEAIRHYIKSADMGLELQNQAAIVKLLCERRAGELLKDTLRHGGDRRPGRHIPKSQLEELGINKMQSNRFQAMASVSEADFWQFVQQLAHERKELTSQGLMRFAELRAGCVQPAGDSDEGPFCRLANGLKSLARQGKQFACVYADPPWGHCRKARIARLPKRLCELPVKAIMAPNAHLHLWAPPGLLKDGMAILSAWGFRYRGELVRHTTPGYGLYWQKDHSTLLLGVRGQLAFRDNGLPGWLGDSDFLGNVDNMEIHALIARASPPAYLDLFAEKTVRDWIAPLAS